MVSCLRALRGLGPKDLIFSVNSLTSLENLGASAEDTQSSLNLSGSMPRSSNTREMAWDRAYAL